MPTLSHNSYCVLLLSLCLARLVFFRDLECFIWTQVNELAEQLKDAATEAEYINGQEKMFGWAMTKYGNVTKVRDEHTMITCLLFLNRLLAHTDHLVCKLNFIRQSDLQAELHQVDNFNVASLWGGPIWYLCCLTCALIVDGQRCFTDGEHTGAIRDPVDHH